MFSLFYCGSISRYITLYLTFNITLQALISPILAERHPRRAFFDHHHASTDYKPLQDVEPTSDFRQGHKGLSTGTAMRLPRGVGPVTSNEYLEPRIESNPDDKYQPGDVLKRMSLGTATNSSFTDAELDRICDHELIQYPSPQGFNASGAGQFASQWWQVSQETPGFQDFFAKNSKRNVSTIDILISDLLSGKEIDCHIYRPCVPLSCSDIVHSIRVKDPALVYAVYYTARHIKNMYDVVNANLQMYNKVDQELNDALPMLVKHFTWREDKDIDKECEHRAQKQISFITTFLLTALIIVGAFTPFTEVASGAISSGIAEGAESIVGATIGVLPKNINAVGLESLGGKIVGGLSNAFRNGEGGAAEWLKSEVPAAITVTGIGVNSYITTHPGKDLASKLCKNVPRVAPGQDDVVYSSIFNQLQERMSGIRSRVEHEINNITHGSTSTVGNWTLFDYLRDGAFYLSNDAENYYLDQREPGLRKLDGVMTSGLIISILKGMGSGVHCAYKVNGCSEDVANGVYCPEQNVACQVFSYLPWDSGMYKVPLWGSKYLDDEGGADTYGFNTRVIANQSWTNYKNIQVLTARQDISHDLLSLADGQLTRLSPVILPVCFDPEGIWPQGSLGPDPVGSDKLENQPEKDRTFPCSCGVVGNETTAFLQSAGLYRPQMIDQYGGTCQKSAVNDHKLGWTPWNLYLSSCSRWKWEDEIRNTTGYYGELKCEENINQYRSLIESKEFTEVEASCYMCVSSESFKSAIEVWRTRHPYDKNDLGDWCDNMSKDRGCVSVQTAHSEPSGADAHNHCSGNDRGKDELKALNTFAGLSEFVPDDRTYVSKEIIMANSGIALWYEHLAPDGQGGEIPRTGKQMKEDLKKLSDICLGQNCGNYVFDLPDSHGKANLKADKYNQWNGCDGICDGQASKHPFTTDPALHNQTDPHTIFQTDPELTAAKQCPIWPRRWMNETTVNDLAPECRGQASNALGMLAVLTPGHTSNVTYRARAYRTFRNAK